MPFSEQMSLSIPADVLVLTVFHLDERSSLCVCVCLCQSTEADFERVPVEAYGLAMLRGMGWKKAEGIGHTFKE